MVFGGPREKFSASEVRPFEHQERGVAHTHTHTERECMRLCQLMLGSLLWSRLLGLQFDAIKTYIQDKGGRVLIMLGEGGENRYGTNINYLLEE